VGWPPKSEAYEVVSEEFNGSVHWPRTRFQAKVKVVVYDETKHSDSAIESPKNERGPDVAIQPMNFG